jgi:hypothetical protein
VVVRAEVDDEDVGHHGAAAAHHGGAVVHLTGEGGGDLDGLHLGLEGPGERAVDHAVEPLLEAVEQTHRASPGARTRPRARMAVPGTPGTCRS